MEANKVSVVVVSYNSSQTVIETLESVLNQDFGTSNIELIFSDDGSTDTTVDLVKKWIKDNEHKFFEVITLFNCENKGVPFNCNTAWKACKQDWVKTIAADDILLPNCISSFVGYVEENPGVRVVFSYMKWFGDVEKVTPSKDQIDFFTYDALKQHEYLKFSSFNIAPTSFIEVKVLSEVGFADEKYRLFEDLPLWLRITSYNIKLNFYKGITVKYRVGDSISKSKTKFINPSFVRDCISLNKDYKKSVFPSVQWFLKHEELFILNYCLLLVRVFGNSYQPSSLLFKISWFFTPITSYNKVLSRVRRLL